MDFELSEEQRMLKEIDKSGERELPLKNGVFQREPDSQSAKNSAKPHNK